MRATHRHPLQPLAGPIGGLRSAPTAVAKHFGASTYKRLHTSPKVFIFFLGRSSTGATTVSISLFGGDCFRRDIRCSLFSHSLFSTRRNRYHQYRDKRRIRLRFFFVFASTTLVIRLNFDYLHNKSFCFWVPTTVDRIGCGRTFVVCSCYTEASF